ncbi:hypothetical protein D3C71_2202990 [compost metagenome]
MSVVEPGLQGYDALCFVHRQGFDHGAFGVFFNPYNWFDGSGLAGLGQLLTQV